MATRHGSARRIETTHQLVGKRTRRLSVLEPLEDRRLLSAVLTGNALAVDGTAGNDQIALAIQGNQIFASINGAQQVFAAADVQSISVNGLAGNDNVAIGQGLIGVHADGGAGDDVLIAGTGGDTLVGGQGNDRYVFHDNWGQAVVNEAAAAGNDTMDFSACSGDMLFTIGTLAVSDGHSTVNHGENNIENLIGGMGNNTFLFQNGASLPGTITGNGLAGKSNTLMYSQYTTDIYADLPSHWATGTAGISGINNIVGGLGNDTLIGDANANVLDGGPGSNTLVGNGGDDRFFSSSGGTSTIVTPAGQGTLDFSNSTGPLTFDMSGSGVIVRNSAGTVLASVGSSMAKIVGSSGDDQFIMGKGASFSGVVDGGLGSDTLDYRSYGKGVSVYLDWRSAATGTGGIANMDNVFGTKFSDRLFGGAGANQLYSFNGNDTVIGQGGNDVMVAGNGNNLLVGSAGTDYIKSGNGKSTIFSMGGRDTIRVGNGANTIYASVKDRVIAGKGNNTLMAGKGTTISGKGHNTKKSISSAATKKALSLVLKKMKIKL